MADGQHASAAAEIARSFFGAINDKKAASIDKETKRRERLVKQFDDIYDDPQNWNDDARQMAFAHANKLRQVLYEPKIPKEYEIDQKTGSVPAYQPFLHATTLKHGPKTPAKPGSPSAAPAQPQQPGAMPDLSALFGAAAAGAGGGGGEFGAAPVSAGAPNAAPATGSNAATATPGMPGGDHFGGNQISPAPAIPEMPEPNLEPRMLSALDRAQQQRDVTDVQTAIDPEVAKALGLPEGANLNPQTASLFRGAADRKIKLALKGLDENGDLLPVDKLPPEIAIKVRGESAVQELMSAKVELIKAQATGLPQQIAIAQRKVAIAEQNANTYAQKAATEASLYGGLGAGGGSNFMGALGTGAETNDPIDAMTEQLLTNQLSYKEIPSKLRPLVSLRVAQKNGIIIPPQLQEKLNQFSEARGVTSTVYDGLEDYVTAKGAAKVEAGYRLVNEVEGLTRIVGRAMGERGVFTDADKKDFTRIMSPGKILTLTTPELAQRWVRNVEEIFNRVENNRLQGFYRRAFQTRGGDIKTNLPGDRNIVHETSALPPMPEPVASTGAPSANGLPPVEKRIAGKTRAVINGKDRVWNGTGWATP